MKKSRLTMLIVCLLWQTPALATDPTTMIGSMLLEKLVENIFSSDDEDTQKTNSRNTNEESPRINNQKSRSGYHSAKY